MAEKLNCWQVKGCGREPGGAKVGELGVCVAATEARLDGVHGGANAGRACWVVSGSLCGGAVQGTFAAKYKACEQCEFYEQVFQEEWPRFHYASGLLERLR